MTEQLLWANETAEKLLHKTLLVSQRDRGKLPYTAVDGRFDDWSDRIWWWTNGFYSGLLWQLYSAYGSEPLRAAAEEMENKLDACLMDYAAIDHDNGFKWLLTAVANYRLTGSLPSRNRGLLAAANLAGRYNPNGSFIRAWNDPLTGETAGWAIIDCMMNLPLLYWASEQTRDPRFAQIARNHADTALRCFIRPDGSANHIVVFDPHTGKMEKSLGGQGYGVGSSWTWGQAWALYCFTLSHMHTGEQRYLDTARKCADYFLSQIPGSGRIPVDFCQPGDCTWEDSTAAAIAACGLLELEKLTRQTRYRDAAVKLLQVLASERCNWDDAVDHLLERCTAAYHDDVHEFPIIYGDYFFTEGILKLCGKGVMLW